MEYKELDVDNEECLKPGAMASAGHYEGGGYSWEPGETPMCSMCNGRVATRATAHLGIILCDNPDCHCIYVMQECDEIEYFEDEDEEELDE